MTLRIRTKIIISFSSIFFIFTCLAALTLYNRNLLYHGIAELEKETNALTLISDLQLNIDMAVMPPNDYIITGDGSERVKFLLLARKIEKNIDDLWELKAMTNHKGLHESIKSSYELIKEKAVEIFTIENPARNKTGALLMVEIDTMASYIITYHLAGLYQDKLTEINQRRVTLNSIRKKVDIFLLFGAFLVVATTILAIIYLTRSLLTPLLALEDGVSYIISGHLDHKINIKDGLEMNTLAANFNTMTERLNKSYDSLELKVLERTEELNKANKTLQEIAVRDGLTGLLNHKTFYEKLEAETLRFHRSGLIFSIIMIDIDKFKSLNDKYGHVIGDMVLKSVSSCLSKSVRETDIVARYGGEEFAILLPDTYKEGAAKLAECIRGSLSEWEITHENTKKDIQVTASFGVATFPEDAEESGSLVEVADQALYKAKESGRNRVVVVTKEMANKKVPLSGPD